MNQLGNVLILHSSRISQISYISQKLKKTLEEEKFSVKMIHDPAQLKSLDLSSFDLLCLGTEKGESNALFTAEILSHPRIALFANS
ncbi:MAG: hypothetical protein AAF696_38950, partial [Bacteroidota bacterium]